MRVHAAIFGACALAAALAANIVLHGVLDWPMGIVFVPVALLLIYPVFLAPPRQFRAWRYAADDEELRIARGVWTRVETIVPYGRVQHIDVAQGPVERAFGVARLILHTAGTAHSEVVLPGLTRARAEAMRDEIRAHIRQDIV